MASHARLRSGFEAIYRTGERRRRGGLTVIRAPGTHEGPPRVGVVAGKRVGNAVRRNRAKRRLRAALERVPLERDTTYVVIASPSVVDAPFEEVVSWLSAGTRGQEET